MRLAYWLACIAFLCAGVVGNAAANDPDSPAAEKGKTSSRIGAHRLEIVTREGNTHVFNVEMAITRDQQRRGLMFRTELAEDAGMLFDFHEPQIITMWMKNTLIPLDMLFIDSTGKIAFIAENTVPESTDIISSTVPVRWVLEVAGGTSSRLKIEIGDALDGLVAR